MAEGTGQGATDLAGDAKRAARFFRNEDGFGQITVSKANQPFSGPVDRFLCSPDGRAAYPIGFFEFGPRPLRQVIHFCKVSDTALIDPLVKLPATISRLTQRVGHALKVVPVHSDQIDTRIY